VARRGFLIITSYFCSIIHFLKINFMGRGDKKTAKGKRFKGSFGKSRPAISPAAKKKAAAKKKS
jgi:30S ribosomal protein S31